MVSFVKATFATWILYLFICSFVGPSKGVVGGLSHCRRHSRWRLCFNPADIKGRGTTKAEIIKQEFVDTDPNVNFMWCDCLKASYNLGVMEQQQNGRISGIIMKLEKKKKKERKKCTRCSTHATKQRAHHSSVKRIENSELLL